MEALWSHAPKECAVAKEQDCGASRQHLLHHVIPFAHECVRATAMSVAPSCPRFGSHPGRPGGAQSVGVSGRGHGEPETARLTHSGHRLCVAACERLYIRADAPLERVSELHAEIVEPIVASAEVGV
jgi:hypothetical protein